MSKANQFAKNEEGVSAVIGVILMVAITVILAAIIAAFVIGMVGQGVKKAYTVAVTVSRIDLNTITISNMGGNDVDELVAYVDATHIPFKVYINGVDQTTAAVGASKLNEGVGASVTLNGITGRSHVTVVGFFVDGSQQVLHDSEV